MHSGKIDICHLFCYRENLLLSKFVTNVWYVKKPQQTIEIINNTRGGIVIFFTDNKRERVYWGANSSPGCRARRLLAELMLP